MTVLLLLILSMQAVQNFGLASVIILAGVVVENLGHLILEIIFVALLCLSLFFGMQVYI